MVFIHGGREKHGSALQPVWLRKIKTGRRKKGKRLDNHKDREFLNLRDTSSSWPGAPLALCGEPRARLPQPFPGMWEIWGSHKPAGHTNYLPCTESSLSSLLPCCWGGRSSRLQAGTSSPCFCSGTTWAGSRLSPEKWGEAGSSKPMQSLRNWNRKKRAGKYLDMALVSVSCQPRAAKALQSPSSSSRHSEELPLHARALQSAGKSVAPTKLTAQPCSHSGIPRKFSDPFMRQSQPSIESVFLSLLILKMNKHRQ